jgi:protoheme IX farnesyltransferase
MSQATTNPTAVKPSIREDTAGVSLARSLIETTKPGITRLVTITALVGFGMGFLSRRHGVAAGSLGADLAHAVGPALAVTAGTAFSAGGANALNQLVERHRDAKMSRTLVRPLPEGRCTPRQVLVTGVALCVVGVALLWALVGLTPALVSLACVASYLMVYTPLKPLTPWATLTGTIPGALPPLIGWSAAQAGLGMASLGQLGGWSLVLLMVAWQMPHSLALAWMYKDDYRLGGYRLLPVVDPDGKRTSLHIAGWTIALVPATILPYVAMRGVVGPVYPVVAALSTLFFAWMAMRLVRQRDRASARRVFLASILHLPLILTVLVGEALVRAMIG